MVSFTVSYFNPPLLAFFLPAPLVPQTMANVRRYGSTDCDSDSNLNSSDRPVAPDQFDERYETGKYEIWAYYAYFIGNSGLTLFNFAPTAFQNLLSQAAGDNGVLHFAGE